MNFYEKFTIQLLFVNWIRAIALALPGAQEKSLRPAETGSGGFSYSERSFNYVGSWRILRR